MAGGGLAGVGARGGLAGVEGGGGELADHSVTDVKLRTATARSVIGRAATTNGDVADIVATADNKYLGRITGGGPDLGFYDARINNVAAGMVIYAGPNGTLLGGWPMGYDETAATFGVSADKPGVYTPISVSNTSTVNPAHARIRVAVAAVAAGNAMYTAYLQGGLGWTWGTLATSGMFCLNPSDGTIGTSDTLQITPAGASTLNGTLDVRGATSGATVSLQARSTSNTASSAAVILAEVAGTTAGDPVMQWSVAGVRQYTIGIDTSSIDRDFAFAIGTALGGVNNIFAISALGCMGLGQALVTTSRLAIKGSVSNFVNFTLTHNCLLGLGMSDVASTVFRVSPVKTVASGASAIWDGVDVIASTLTLSGSTNVTTATGVNLVALRAPTISAASALTVTNASTLYIGGAPAGAGAGPATLTNAYALWVDAGLVRIDGNGTNVLELPADATGNTTAATGRIPVLVGGATKYVRYYAD